MSEASRALSVRPPIDGQMFVRDIDASIDQFLLPQEFNRAYITVKADGGSGKIIFALNTGQTLALSLTPTESTLDSDSVIQAASQAGWDFSDGEELHFDLGAMFPSSADAVGNNKSRIRVGILGDSATGQLVFRRS